MKHKHAKMIKAKADNMELVLLVKIEGEWWKSISDLPVDNGLDYFLCHPKHADQAIHWLNGGKTQLYSGDRFYDMPMYDGGKWHIDLVFMDECRESRIKPKKEKRWIVVDEAFMTNELGVEGNYCSQAYVSKEDAASHMMAMRESQNITHRPQVIEIEIEVD